MEQNKVNWDSLISFEDYSPCVYGIKLGDDYQKSRIILRKFNKVCNDRSFLRLKREYGLCVDIEGNNHIVSRIIIYIPSEVKKDGIDYPINIERTVKEISTLFKNNIAYDRIHYSSNFSYEYNDKLKDTRIHFENDIFTVEIQLSKINVYDHVYDDERDYVDGIDVTITFNDYLKEKGDIDHISYEVY